MMQQSLVLGIDIGGTNTVLGIVDRRGQILERAAMATSEFSSVAAYIEALRLKATALMEAVGRQRIIGCGVGAPNGNYYTGEIVDAANLPWKGIIPLANLLKDAFHLPVRLTNDANAAALGEMLYGAGKGLKDFVVVTLGTGVGSGFVVNGSVMYGHDGFAGELGHITVEPGGRQCGCGRRGCLETYASATGVVFTAREWMAKTETDSVLRKHGDAITAKQVQAAAVDGDEMARSILTYTGEILGAALANVVAITSPAAIIFFGGLAKAGELLLGPARLQMEQNVLSVYRNKVRFLLSELPDADAAVLGASALAW